MLNEDRRKRRSKRLLGQALLALIAEKSYSSITVQEISNRADVGYMTFYRHYHNKDALLVAQLQTMMEETFSNSMSDHKDIGLIVFSFVEKHQSLFRLVLQSDTLSIARVWIRERIANKLLQASWLFPAKPHPLISNELIANHLASSMLNLIGWWLDNQTAYSSEDMGQIYQQLVLQPTVGFGNLAYKL